MARFYPSGGAGGADVSVVTATAANVEKGKVIVGPDGKPLTGELELVGTAGDSQVLAGETYYNTDLHQIRTGAMVNRGAWNHSGLLAGASVTIPGGYHNEAGKVTAASLASQTGGATAEDRYVYSGRTYWKDGVLRTGGMTVSSVVSFSVAAYSTDQVIATWKWPSTGPYSGVAICAKTGGYPTNINDGRVYTGVGSSSALGSSSSVVIGGLAVGTTYYFRIWVYCTTSAGDLYSTTRDATCTTTARGQQIFTTSGTFTVPKNVKKVQVFLVGAGGAGNDFSSGYPSVYDTNITYQLGGGGGGGGYTKTQYVDVTDGQQINVVVGAGGYSDGGQSSFGSVIAEGGKISTRKCDGGNGGSGGGYGGSGRQSQTTVSNGTNGGSNGASGASHSVVMNRVGSGQGTTTRAFGESSGTLYAGAGGGGIAYRFGIKAYGGSGGGGNGSGPSDEGPATAGAANTGGGGGGGGYDYGTSTNYGKQGGSGIVIVRWGY